MPSSISSSDRLASPASLRLWLGVFAAGFMLVTALLLLSFTTQAPYGDLTRIGALSESRFGWRDAQPALDPTLLSSSPIDQADVLVVGDSFSVATGENPHEGLLWQSRLVAAGWRVASMHWDRAHPLCPDFPDWLAHHGFKGRWVVLQSVERALDDRLTPAHRCRTTPRPLLRAFHVAAPPTEAPPPQWNTNETLLTGISTAWNTWRAMHSLEPAVFKDLSASDSIRLQPLAQGCRLFSHSACDRALFLFDDEIKPRLHARHVPQMATAAAPLAHHWRTAWLIVPNKRTFYLEPTHFAPVSSAIQQRGLGPDVLATLQAASGTGRDLYFPNDTHLSPRGALRLGNAVAHWLREPPR